MKKRILHQILKRISNLPKGKHRLQYIKNSIRLIAAKKTKSLRQPYPNTIMLEITNLCQLHCKTCAREYSFGQVMDKGHMDISEAKKFVDENHMYLDKIALTGLGEPLLYPHLSVLIDHIRKRNDGVLIFFSTNALHKKAVEIVNKVADKIDTVQISMDGWSETFKKIRKGSDFKQFVENVGRLAMLSRKNRFDITLNMVVFEDNYKEMNKILTFADEHGIKDVNFNSFNLVAIENPESVYSFYNSIGFKNELEKTAALSRQLGIHLQFPNISNKNSFSTCPYPWSNYTITWDGYLVPCCAKPFPKELNFGNVFNDGLLACINHKRLMNFRKLAKRNVTPAFCVNCHHVENE